MKLDEIDQGLVAALVKDGRLPLKTVAERVGLSAPSAAERVRRLEERGVIRGFSADVDTQALGYPLQAIVRIKPLPGKLHAVQQLIEAIPEFGECDKVTGEDCFIGRLHLRSIAHLDLILDRISDKAETNTAIVKSQPVKRRLPPLA